MQGDISSLYLPDVGLFFATQAPLQGDIPYMAGARRGSVTEACCRGMTCRHRIEEMMVRVFDKELMSEARRAAGMTQGELGDRVGRNRVTISDIERGKLRPGGELAQHIAEVLGLDVESFWTDPPAQHRDEAPNLTMEEVQVINAMRSVGRVERAKIWAFAMGLAAGGSAAGANAAAEIASAAETANLAERVAAETQADSA